MTTRSDGAAVLAEYDAESEQLRERLMTMRRRMHAMESRHQLRQRAASSPANEPPIRLAAPTATAPMPSPSWIASDSRIYATR